MISAILFSSLAQATPTDIPKRDLPKLTVCVVCDASGVGHGEEKPVAGVMWEGKAYYFCASSEVAKFKKDPKSYMPPVVPRLAPAFDLIDKNGKLWNAEAMKGKLVMLDFWATWCGPCKEMKPIVEKTHEKFGRSNLEVLSVSIDEKEATLDTYLKKNKFANPVVFDSRQVWAAYGVKVIPTFVLIKDGQIVWQKVGKFPAAELEKVLNTHKISPLN